MLPDDAAIHSLDDVTDKEFLLAFLSDREPHTLNEILRRSFDVRGHGLTVHSRVADLRKDGCEILWWHRPGEKRANSSVYQLFYSPSALGEPSSAANGGSPSATHDGARPGYEGGSRSPLLPAEPQDHETDRLSPTHDDLGAGSRVAASSDRQGHSEAYPSEPADERGIEPQKEMVGEASAPLRLPGQLAIDDLVDDRCAAYCAQFCPHCGERYDDHEWHGIGMCVPNPEEDTAA